MDIQKRLLSDLSSAASDILSMHQELFEIFKYNPSDLREYIFHGKEADENNEDGYVHIVDKYNKELIQHQRISSTNASTGISNLNNRLSYMNLGGNNQPSSSYIPPPQPTYAVANQGYDFGNSYSAQGYSSSSAGQLVPYSPPHDYANMQIVPYVPPADNQITLSDNNLLRLYPEIREINLVLCDIQNLPIRDRNIHNPSEEYIKLERGFCNLSKSLADKLMGSYNTKTAGDINNSIQSGDYAKAEKLIYVLYELKTVYMPRIPFMQAFAINKDPFLNDLAGRFRNIVASLKANADVRNKNTPLNTKIKLEAGVSNGTDALAKACTAASKTQEFISMCGSTSFAMPIILTINIIGKVSFMVPLKKDEKILASVNDIYGDCDNI